MTRPNMKKKCKELGLLEELLAITLLSPALDLNISRPGDVAHSEFKGIARHALTLLFSDILKTSFHFEFARAFAATSTPPGWGQVQNIQKYLGSYSMQELGRASMIAPLTLQKFLQDIKLRPHFYKAIDLELKQSSDESGFTRADFVTHCFATIAKCNAVIMGPYI